MIGRYLSYFVCALLWLGSVFQLSVITIRMWRGGVADIPLIGRLLSQPQIEDRAAPTVLLFVFGWVLIELMLHFFRVVKELFAVSQFCSTADPASPEAIAAKLQSIPSDTRAGRRAALFSKSAGKNLNDSLAGAAALDAASVDNAYNFIHVYVWILPVIGFIGTAWGMSHAIGGFGEALKGNLDVSSMTARLSQLVIPGLASAFTTTIIALIGAIISHFCASVIQSAEHATLNDLDQACVQVLAKLPGDTPALNSLATAAAVLQRAADRLGQLSLDNTVNQLSTAANAVQAAADTLRNAASTLEHAARAPYHITVTRGDD